MPLYSAASATLQQDLHRPNVKNVESDQSTNKFLLSGTLSIPERSAWRHRMPFYTLQARCVVVFSSPSILVSSSLRLPIPIYSSLSPPLLVSLSALVPLSATLLVCIQIHSRRHAEA